MTPQKLAGYLSEIVARNTDSGAVMEQGGSDQGAICFDRCGVVHVSGREDSGICGCGTVRRDKGVVMREDGLVPCEFCGNYVGQLTKGLCPTCYAEAKAMTCGHPQCCLIETADEMYCIVCNERGLVNAQWLDMVARILGPIPCGGTSIQIAERHLRNCCKEVPA